MGTPTVRVVFESGSLVLEGLAGGLGAEAPAPGCLWDPRVSAWRAPAWRYREVLTALTRRSRAGEFALEDAARRYAALGLVHRAERSAFVHQTEAVAAWKARGMRGVVVLPTGAGKSYVAEMAIREAQRSTLVVAPTLDLMNQWYDVLRTAFDAPVGLLGGGYVDPRDLTVATYDSAYLHMERLGDRWGLVIFDEVHHLPGPSFLQGAECSVAPYRLGLTATLAPTAARPCSPTAWALSCTRAASKTSRANTWPPTTCSRCLSTSPTTRPPATPRPGGCTATSSTTAASTWARRTAGHVFCSFSARSPEGRRAFLAYRTQRQISLASEGKLAVLEGLLRQHARDRVLIFTNDNDTVYTISRTFLIPALTHQTDLKERREHLARFNDGQYPALVTSRVLNEGVNIPAANVAIVLSGTASVREHVQRLGRVLRRQEGKRATLYEVITRGTAEERQSDRRRDHDAYR